MREHLHHLSELYTGYPTSDLKKIKNTYKDQYKTAIKTAKIRANDNLIRNAPNHTKCMWNIINEYQRVIEVKQDGVIISPDQFNHFFINIAHELQAKSFDPVQDVPEAAHPAFSFNEVTLNEIRDVISSLKNNPFGIDVT